MQTETPNPNIWTDFHAAIERLGSIADQVERNLAPTAKQEFIKTLEASETLHLLNSVNDNLIDKLRKRNYFNALLLATKARIEEAKALVLISGAIDGKNAEIREAQLLIALKDDPAYQQARTEAETIEERIADNEADLESHRSQQAALKIKLRLIAAQLEYLSEAR